MHTTTSASIFEYISTNASHGQIVLDADGRIVHWNPWIAQSSGVAAEHAVGATLEEVFEELPERFLAVVRQSLESSITSVISRAFLPHPLPLRNRQFRDRWMVQGVEVSGFRDESGARHCLICVSDYSREAQREHLLLDNASELERKNRQLDSFTRMVGHDLRAPLHNVLQLTELLREDLDGALNDDAETDLGLIESGVHRMIELVHAMLEMAQMEHRTVEAREFSLDEAADAALGNLRTQIREAGGVVTRDELPRACGDMVLVTQLYQNLIGNALKFVRGRSPRIHLTAEQRPDDLQLLGVRDNGIGIPPEAAKQVFAPFRRLHGESEFQGCGIGLSICQRIVELHGGEIWFDPECEDGSHVRFRLAAGPADSST